MIYFAAFAIMMAMAGMNAYAKVSARNNFYHVNERGIVVAHHGDHGMPVVHKGSTPPSHGSPPRSRSR